jgi:hypothetical protein
MEILHATTNWLLWPNESYSIAGGKLNTDEILQIQDWMVSAIRDISVFLREKYDVMRVEGIVSFEEYLDAVVRTAVKTVCGWYAEDGGEGSLGLLDVLVAVCATNDVELITWAMRGIRGIIEHMDKGADELWSLKDGLLMLLDCVYDSVKSAKETRMAREVCMLFQSLVDMQPLCLTEPTIRSFPAKLMDSLPLGTTDTAHWHAKTNASDLAVQILFKMMNDGDAAEKRASQKMLKKYMSRMVQLFHSSARPKDPQEVSSLASALEELQF